MSSVQWFAESSAMSIIDVPQSFQAAVDPARLSSSQRRCFAPSSDRLGAVAFGQGPSRIGPADGVPEQSGDAEGEYWWRSVRKTSALRPSRTRR